MTIPPVLNPHRVTTAQGTWTLTGCLPPGRALTTISVSSPSFVIGRKTGVDLPLASPCVSGRHAEILQVGNHLFVRDLNSTNGTFVNRRRVYQPTPVASGDHIEVADVEFRLEFQPSPNAPSDTQILKKTNQVLDAFESDWILSQFEDLMSLRAIQPYYQPIVSMEDDSIMGFEALARSTICGLENPAQLFQTAKLVNREAELSILCRQRAAECSQWMAPSDLVFINTHPLESLNVDVLPCVRRLRNQYPDVKIVVEVHEGAVQSPDLMREFAAELRDHEVGVAYDDFGAGQSRLTELTLVPPDFLKFDAGLIRNLDQATAQHHRMLSMLIDVAKDSNTQVLAEGIETAEEAEVCRDLGFDCAQGYYFGRPAPTTDRSAWDTQPIHVRQ
ncbi:MAG: EAL domain-containing protein [Planctomycetaceae bacterium]|nr:EAL domain-containing protein [Planctomycetaceae bacterium]